MATPHLTPATQWKAPWPAAPAARRVPAHPQHGGDIQGQLSGTNHPEHKLLPPVPHTTFGGSTAALGTFAKPRRS